MKTRLSFTRLLIITVIVLVLLGAIRPPLL